MYSTSGSLKQEVTAPYSLCCHVNDGTCGQPPVPRLGLGFPCFPLLCIVYSKINVVVLTTRAAGAGGPGCRQVMRQSVVLWGRLMCVLVQAGAARIWVFTFSFIMFLDWTDCSFCRNLFWNIVANHDVTCIYCRNNHKLIITVKQVSLYLVSIANYFTYTHTHCDDRSPRTHYVHAHKISPVVHTQAWNTGCCTPEHTHSSTHALPTDCWNS